MPKLGCREFKYGFEPVFCVNVESISSSIRLRHKTCSLNLQILLV